MNRHERRRAERKEAELARSTFRNRWRNLGERLTGKNLSADELTVVPIDGHLSLVLLTVHTDCVDHLAVHLSDAAAVWMTTHEAQGGAS